MTETITRIRWESNGYTGFLGHVGTIEAWVFQVWNTRAGNWKLHSTLPGPLDDCRCGDGPDELKAKAERWLEEFVSSLGAVFPGPAQPECHRCDEPITGTPVTDPDDPMGRKFCSGECADASAEQAGGAFTDIEYGAEFD